VSFKWFPLLYKLKSFIIQVKKKTTLLPRCYRVLLTESGKGCDPRPSSASLVSSTSSVVCSPFSAFLLFQRSSLPFFASSVSLSLSLSLTSSVAWLWLCYWNEEVFVCVLLSTMKGVWIPKEMIRDCYP